jgi:hypothetical protein
MDVAVGLGWVAERLKTELEVEVGGGLGAAGCITDGWAGADQSKRSPRPEEDAWAGLTEGLAELKTPKLSVVVMDGFFCCCAVGGPALLSKKPPPPKLEKAEFVG